MKKRLTVGCMAPGRPPGIRDVARYIYFEIIDFTPEQLRN